VPSGRVDAYTSAWWNVSAITAAGTEAVYGPDHKRVVITDNLSLLNSVSAIEDYLAGATGGASPASPITLPAVFLSLADNDGNGWEGLLDAINGKSRYVNLDLSTCSMTDMTITPGEFDPNIANSYGKNYIVSLVLPNEATIIKAGASVTDAAFKNFTNLASVSGTNIVTLGDYAFYGRSSLTTVNFPAAADIGEAAFDACANLSSVDISEATDIGNTAFFGCTSLTTLNLSAAGTIGNGAFTYCIGLSTLYLPSTPPILGTNVFVSTNLGAGEGTTLTIKVYPGTEAAYTAPTPGGWGVLATTLAGANAAFYGGDHKEIVIDDTP
jgi:hypothetical protein